jgi:histidyl-tRNA synthetase
MYRVLNSGDFIVNVDINTNKNDIIPMISQKGLRYDLTVPLMRYVCNHIGEIVFPFKRYQIQPVWRADKPQNGRYREFYQCDIDIVGSKSLSCEVELLSIVHDVLNNLKIPNYKIKISDRRIISDICRCCDVENMANQLYIILDKCDKIGREKTLEQIQTLGNKTITEIFEYLFTNTTTSTSDSINIMNHIGKKYCNIDDWEALRDLVTITDMVSDSCGEHIAIDYTLARGLAYYTGSIFEVVVENSNVGSIIGGGRYHKFAEYYQQPQLKSVGLSFGIDRIFQLLEQMTLFIDTNDRKHVLVMNDINNKEEIVRELHSHNVMAEYVLDDLDYGKQFRYAEKKRINYVLCYRYIDNKRVGMYLVNICTKDEVMVEVIDDIVNVFV